MRRRTKVLLALLAILLLMILFRGPLYRFAVHYEPIRERQVIPLSDPVVEHRLVKRMIHDQPQSIKEQIDVALAVTSGRLDFVARAANTDPNEYWPDNNDANCIGYAALFATLLQAELDSTHMGKRYEVRHLVGKLSLMGFDLHSWFSSPFFADHDYNEIRDKVTGEAWHVDPTLHDHLRIRFVTSQHALHTGN